MSSTTLYRYFPIYMILDVSNVHNPLLDIHSQRISSGGRYERKRKGKQTDDTAFPDAE